jgi:CheY-like chemotaxis protein
VDDEAVIIKVLKRFLLNQGYRVTMHTDSQAALAAFQADPAGYDRLWRRPDGSTAGHGAE